MDESLYKAQPASRQPDHRHPPMLACGTCFHVCVGSWSPQRWMQGDQCGIICFSSAAWLFFSVSGESWDAYVDSTSWRKELPVLPCEHWAHQCWLMTLSRQGSSLHLLLVCMGWSTRSFLDKNVTQAIHFPDVNSANVLMTFQNWYWALLHVLAWTSLIACVFYTEYFPFNVVLKSFILFSQTEARPKVSLVCCREIKMKNKCHLAFVI